MTRVTKIENLRERRKALGISQVTLAKLVGVSMLTVQLWERRVSGPSETNKTKLESILQQLEEEVARNTGAG